MYIYHPHVIHRAGISVHNVQAPGFYEKLGYTELYRRPGHFGGHSYIYYTKAVR